MRYIVAVSGGIDSIVLLHQLVVAGEHQLIVAHFDHGIRPDSAADARFIEALATSYGLPYVGCREELGPKASEELARNRRYYFLRQLASQRDAVVVTAHHQDDAIESIAINLQRGTGWRGLAVLDAPDIVRPLLGQPKRVLRQYALDHRLEWVEDSTNADTVYLRNRVRRRIARQLDAATLQALWGLRQQQVALRQSVMAETKSFMRDMGEYQRYGVVMSDSHVAGELLRAMIVAAGLPAPTRPQLAQALLAIKVALPGGICQIGDGVQLRFTKRTFIVETTR